MSTATTDKNNTSQSSSPTLETKTLDKQDDIEAQGQEKGPSEEPPKPAAPDFPDGGLEAWLVVLGGVICNIVAFGYVTSFGVFQSYYELGPLKHETPSNIAWIGSIQAFMLFFPALFGGALFDAGWFRLPLFISSVGIVVFTFLLAECKEFYQFILCQGIASGFAIGMLFSPVMTVVGQWWLKKRGIAFGLVMLGSSVGGVALPIMVRKLIPRVGFPWAIRSMAFLFLGILIIPNLTLKTRLPFHPRKGLKAVWDAEQFTNVKYSLYVLGGMLTFLGLYVVMVFVDISAASHGVPENFSFYLIALLNGISGVGRVIAGKSSDKYGPGNVVIPSLIASSAITFAFPFAKHKTDFILIAVFYGLTSGCFITCYMLPIFAFGEMKDAGKRMGMGMSCVSFAALAGNPAAGALIRKYGWGSAGYYGGASMAAGAIAIIIARHIHLEGKLVGRF